jgi:murein DD-endopeptidase MepM/ murein hydrolase activator NlpD
MHPERTITVDLSPLHLRAGAITVGVVTTLFFALVGQLVHQEARRPADAEALASAAETRLEQVERLRTVGARLAETERLLDRVARTEATVRAATGLREGDVLQVDTPPLPIEEAVAALRSSDESRPVSALHDLDVAARAGTQGLKDAEARLAELKTGVEDVVRWLASVPVLRPAAGDLNEGFRPWRFRGLRRHEGLDIDGERGDPILAAGDGVVVYSRWRPDYGRMVILDHGFGFRTRYAHLDRIDVEMGDRVERGQRIGALGNTGRSTGPHLHYEVRVAGRAVDPKDYIVD